MQKEQYPRTILSILVLITLLLPAPSLFALTLKGPDGQELVLKKLYMKVVVDGPLSLTEMSMTFHNPQLRMIEGKFKIALPEGATISRLSKEVEGKMMEGEVVERQRAKRIYTQILHTQRDPALLENEQGNNFTCRIYPINSQATFKLILAYSKLTKMKADGKRQLIIPLRKMPQVENFKMAAFVKTAPNETFAFKARGWFKDLLHIKKTNEKNKMVLLLKKKNFTPQEDLKLSFETNEASKNKDQATIYRYKNLQMVCYRPYKKQKPAIPVYEDWRWYVDTSTSMNMHCANPCQILKALLKELEELTPPSTSYVECRMTERSLYAFHTEIKKLHSWNKIGVSREIENAIGKLKKHNFYGGTDLSQLWRAIKKDSDKRWRPTNYVVITDGCATFGALPIKLMLTQPLKDIHKVHVLVLGTNEDSINTSALARWGQGHIVHLTLTEKWAKEAKRAAQELVQPLGSSFSLQCKNAKWMAPIDFYDQRPGEEIVAFIKEVQGSPIKLTPCPGTKIVELNSTGPILEREAYRARLRELERKRRRSKGREKVRLTKKSIELSQKHRVLCPLTALLVLESENDYKRFKVPRQGRHDILTIQKGAIVCKEPSSPVIKKLEARAALSAELFVGEKKRRRVYSSAKNLHTAAVAITDGIFNTQRVIESFKGRRRRPDEVFEASEIPEGYYEREVQLITGGKKGIGAVFLEKAPPRRKPKPSWTKPKKKEDTLQSLYALHLAVRKSPRKRKPRKRYCDELAKIGFYRDLKLESLNWLQYDPKNPLVYSYLTCACFQLTDPYCAARAAMSLVEISPSNSSYWNLAGFLLLKANENERAEQAFRQAIQVNPNRHNNYRGLSLALWCQGRHREAVKTLVGQLAKVHHKRYGQIKTVLRDELGYILRSWQLATNGESTADIQHLALQYKIPLEEKEALRITLHWETDNCDVTLCVSPPTGGTLTTYNPCWRGLGPEYVSVPHSNIEEGKYHVGLYYSANTMGLVRPIVVILRPVVSPLPNMEIHTTTLTPHNFGTSLLTKIEVHN